MLLDLHYSFLLYSSNFHAKSVNTHHIHTINITYCDIRTICIPIFVGIMCLLPYLAVSQFIRGISTPALKLAIDLTFNHIINTPYRYGVSCHSQDGSPIFFLNKSIRSIGIMIPVLILGLSPICSIAHLKNSIIIKSMEFTIDFSRINNHSYQYLPTIPFIFRLINCAYDLQSVNNILIQNLFSFFPIRHVVRQEHIKLFAVIWI